MRVSCFDVKEIPINVLTILKYSKQILVVQGTRLDVSKQRASFDFQQMFIEGFPMNCPAAKK
jgi:hypothetical protein